MVGLPWFVDNTDQRGYFSRVIVLMMGDTGKFKTIQYLDYQKVGKPSQILVSCYKIEKD